MSDFDALIALAERPVPEGRVGVDWTMLVPPAEWQEHQERLQSVIDAQDFAAHPTQGASS